MERDDLVRQNEELRAQLAQQKRTVEVLSQQVGKLLDGVARLTKKPANAKKKGKGAPPAAEATAEPPPKPPEPAERKGTDGRTGPGPRRGPLPKLSDLPVNRGKGRLHLLTPMAFAEHRGAI